MTAKNGDEDEERRAPTITSIARLTMLFQPCSGTCVRLMTGIPSRSSSTALIVAYCTRSGTTLMSTHSLLTFLMRRSSFACSSRGSAT